MMEFVGNNIAFLFFISVVVFVAGYLIPFDAYKLPIQILGVVMMGALLFLAGESKSNREWEQKMDSARERIAQLEKRQPEVSIQVVTEYVDRIKYIEKVNVQTVREFITVENDKAFVINKGFERLYDATVKNIDVIPQEGDSEPSDIQLSDLAEIDRFNIKQYHKLKTQNDSLKKWIEEQEKLWNESR